MLILALLFPSIIQFAIIDMGIDEIYSLACYYSISNMLWSYHFISVAAPSPPTEASGYFSWIYFLIPAFQTNALITIYVIIIAFSPRLVFVYMMFRYYKRRTSKLRVILVGIVAEYLSWSLSSLGLPLDYSYIILYLSIPTPFAFIIALILLNLISPLKSQIKTDTETDSMDSPLIETN
jgi:hypothetical protein